MPIDGSVVFEGDPSWDPTQTSNEGCIFVIKGQECLITHILCIHISRFEIPFLSSPSPSPIPSLFLPLLFVSQALHITNMKQMTLRVLIQVQFRPPPRDGAKVDLKRAIVLLTRKVYKLEGNRHSHHLSALTNSALLVK